MYIHTYMQPSRIMSSHAVAYLHSVLTCPDPPRAAWNADKLGGCALSGLAAFFEMDHGFMVDFYSVGGTLGNGRRYGLPNGVGPRCVNGWGFEL